MSDGDIFADALALPNVERAAFLDAACGADAALRARVEALLAGHEKAEAVMPAPIADRLMSAEEKPGDRIGRYKLLQKIGEGGCGIVWMAEQEEPVRRRVALKVIKLGMDTKEVVVRFEAERQALALMDHPNIARVFDGGTTDAGRPFFAMELVRGIPITRYCDENHLSPVARLELFITVCHAIQHAHQKGIIHRDLKPSNILVTVNDGAAVPKVIDFGIAKATQGRLTDHTLFTAFEQFIGTPVYMSPEQAEMSSVEIDLRSDIYSLGVLLYESLAGEPPFDRKSFLSAGVDEIRRQIREREPPRPSTRFSTLAENERATVACLRGTAPVELAVLLRGDLDWIVMRCLEKDRARRYDSARALAADLQRHLRHEPVVARPPSTVYVLGKFVRRHRFGVAATAAVILALGAGGAMSAWQAARATRAEQLAAELTAPATPVDAKSIAVLPFDNLSPDKDANAFFADGVQEDIITNLSFIRELRCVPRSTAMVYRGTKKTNRELARELGVARLLSGTVRRAGDQVRLTVTLLDPRTDATLWSKSYDKNLTDIFAIQSELAQAVAAELKATLSPEEKNLVARRPTDNATAYDLYLKARQIHYGQNHEPATRDDMESLLKAAVTLDPKFALAWAELAWLHAYFYLDFRDHTPTRLAKAKAAIDHALRLAPDAPEVIQSLGFYYYGQRDYTRAIEQYEKCARLRPNAPDLLYALALIHRRQGRWAQSLEEFRAIAQLDPANLDNASQVANTAFAGRRWELAIAAQSRFVALTPNPQPEVIELARIAFWSRGSTRETEELLAGLSAKEAGSAYERNLRRTLALMRGDYAEIASPDRVARASKAADGNTLGGRWWAGGDLPTATALAAQGNSAGACALLERFPALFRAQLELDPENPTLWTDLGRVEAVLGHKEEALRCVRKGVEMLPVSVDAALGAVLRCDLAFVYAWTGEKDNALAEYARLLKTALGGGLVNVHVMRHHPFFFPLQGDPRFEALLDDPKNNAPLF